VIRTGTVAVLLLAVLLLAVGAGATFAAGGRDGEPTLGTTGRTDVDAPPPPPAAPARGRLATAPPTAAPAADHRRELLLPDGTYVPTLNGATDAAPLHEYWGPREWSPIVAVERNDAGVDWYRHANGSYSTTEMVMRSDLGRLAALTRVAHIGQAPVAPAPARKAPK
jgi:hypothetical protein